jgi:hypothetical protein
VTAGRRGAGTGTVTASQADSESLSDSVRLGSSSSVTGHRAAAAAPGGEHEPGAAVPPRAALVLKYGVSTSLTRNSGQSVLRGTPGSARARERPRPSGSESAEPLKLARLAQ